MLLVGHDAQDVTGRRDLGQAQQHERGRRPALADALALAVLERAHAPGRVAHDDRVADAQRAGLDEDRGHRAAALVELGLDDRADGRPLGVGPQVLQVGHQEDHLQQVVDAQALLGADLDEGHVAAVVLDHDAVLGQLGLDAVGVGVRLVDLVEGDDDRHLGRAGVVDRLQRLGHHAVVGGDHQDRDVGDLGAACAHGREGLVTGRVEEDDAPAVVGDLAGADVLGDAAALAAGDVGRADGVEKARLAVVDVAHDGHDRGARHELGRVGVLEEDLLGGLGDGRLAVGLGRLRGGRLGDLVAEFAGHQAGRVAVDQLVDRGEDAALDQLADDVRDVHAEQLGELLDRQRRGDLDRATLGRVDDLDDRRAALERRAGGLAGTAPVARPAAATRHGGLLGHASGVRPATGRAGRRGGRCRGRAGSRRA